MDADGLVFIEQTQELTHVHGCTICQCQGCQCHLGSTLASITCRPKKKWWKWFKFYICICMHPWLFLGAACIHDLVSFASKVCTPRPFIQLINKKSFGDMRYGILLRSNIYTSTSSKKVWNNTQSKSASQQIVQVFQLTFSPNVTLYYLSSYDVINLLCLCQNTMHGALLWRLGEFSIIESSVVFLWAEDLPDQVCIRRMQSPAFSSHSIFT